MLQMLKKHSKNTITSSFCRLLEIISYKIFSIQREDVLLECLNSPGTKTYRIEEVPADQLHPADDELLIPVAHFHKVGTPRHDAGWPRITTALHSVQSQAAINVKNARFADFK